MHVCSIGLISDSKGWPPCERAMSHLYRCNGRTVVAHNRTWDERALAMCSRHIKIPVGTGSRAQGVAPGDRGRRLRDPTDIAQTDADVWRGSRGCERA